MIRVTKTLQRAGCALLLGLAVATCRDDPTGPGQRASLALAPVLPAQALNLAAFGLTIDSLRVIIVRPPGDTVINTAVAFAVDQDSVALQLELDLEAETETFDVTLQLSGGGFVLFSATTTVDVVAGQSGAGDPVEIANFAYTGPGAGITSLVVTPSDSVIRLTDSLRFRVDAFAGAVPVTQFYVTWSTSNETLAPINAHGVLLAPALRGAVQVIATTPNGIADTVPVTFVPVPVSIVPVGPIPADVAPGSMIGPLRARVLAADGFGVKGIPVAFAAVSGGGSVNNALVVSDTGGYVVTPATAGTGAVSVYTATAAGVATPATFSVTTLAPPSGTQLAFSVPPTGAVVNLPFGVIVEVRDAQGVVVPTATDPVTIALGANPGSATLGGTLTVNAVQGVAVFADLTLNQPGTGYTLVASAPGLTAATSPAFDAILGLTGRQWTNPAGGNWSDPANWSGGIVPGTADTVYIALDGTYTVTLDVNDTVAYLFMGAASGLQTLLANNRTLGIDSAAVFNASTTLSLTSSTINIGSTAGALVTSGTVLVAPGTSQITGGVYVDATGHLTLNGNNGTATLVTDADVLNFGTIELTGTSWGGQLMVTNGQLLIGPTGQLRVLGVTGSGVTGSLQNQGTVQVDAPWTLAGADANHTNLGTIAVSGGDWTLTQTGTAPSFTTSGIVTVGAGRAWNVTGGVVDYANPTPGGIGGQGTITFNSVVFDITPDLTADTLALTFSNSTVNGPGSIIVAPAATISLTNSVVNAPVINNGTLQSNPGSTTLNGVFSNEAGALLRLQGNNGNANLSVTNGLLNQGTIELTGTSWGGHLTVTNGNLVNTVGSQLHVLNGSGSSVTGTLSNSGSVLIDGPFMLAGSGADHVNSGTIQVGGADWTLTQTGSTPSFTTTGSIFVGSGRIWSVNGGVVTYQAGALAGLGRVALSGATLELGGSFTHDTLALDLSGTTVNGPGTLTVAGATTLAVTNSVINAPLVNQGTIQANPGTSILNGTFDNLNGGLLRLFGNNGNANVTVANTFTNAGTIELTGTSWGGHVTVTTGSLINAPGALLRVSQGASNSLTGTLDNQGTVQIDGPWVLSGAGAAHLNSGTIAVGGADWSLNQTGTTPSFSTSGTVTVGVGRTWNVSGGSLNYQTGGTIGGRGAMALTGATLALGENLTHDTLTVSLSSTTVNGPGVLTVAGAATLAVSNSTVNATLVNQGTIQANPGSSTFNGAFANLGGALLRLLGNNGNSNVTVATPFTNSGTIELTGTSWGGSLTVAGGALTNAPGATVHAVAGTSNRFTGGLVNQGLLRLSGASLTVGNTGETLTGTAGVFDVAGGQTLTVNEGTLVIGNATGLVGTGTIALVGLTVLTLASDVALAANQPAWVFPGNTTINGPGALTNQVTLLLTGEVVNTTLTNLGLLEVPGGSTVQLNGPFTQTGTVRLNGDNGDANLVVAAAFTNQGSIELTGTSWGGNLTVGGILTNANGATLAVLPGTGGTRTLDALIDNQGVVAIAGPLNLNQSLSNAGTVDWSDGSVAVKSGTTLDVLARATFNVSSQGQWNGTGGQAFLEVRGEGAMKVTTAGATAIGPLMVLDNAGTLDIQAPAALKVSGDFNILAGTGELIGTGTLDVGNSPKVTNLGTVKPGGDAPGILTIVAPAGGWRQGTGSNLVIDITGTTPGLEYDQLVVAGAAILGGVINVNRTATAPRLTEYYPLTATVDIGGVLLPGNLDQLIPPMTLLLPDLSSIPMRVILQQL